MISAQRITELLSFFYVQRVRGFDPPGDSPYMDSESAARFLHELDRASRYVEFGSGGTTVAADKAGVETVSVESDRFYARAVAKRLSGRHVRQVVVNCGLTREWGFPLFPDVRKARKYVTAPYGDGPFPDLVLVDGRWRVACALECAEQARNRGLSTILMIDDYAGRLHYHSVEDHLGPPEMAGRAAVFRIGQQSVPRSAIEQAMADPR